MLNRHFWNVFFYFRYTTKEGLFLVLGRYSGETVDLCKRLSEHAIKVFDSYWISEYGDRLPHKAVFHLAPHYRVVVTILWRGELFSRACRTKKHAEKQARVVFFLETTAIIASQAFGSLKRGGIDDTNKQIPSTTTISTPQPFRHSAIPDHLWPSREIAIGPTITLNQMYGSVYLNQMLKHGWGKGGCLDCGDMGRLKCQRCTAATDGGCMYALVNSVNTCFSLLGADGVADLEFARQDWRDKYYKHNPEAQEKFDTCNGHEYTDCINHPGCGRLQNAIIMGCRTVKHWTETFEADSTMDWNACLLSKGHKWLEQYVSPSFAVRVGYQRGNGVCLKLPPRWTAEFVKHKGNNRIFIE